MLHELLFAAVRSLVLAALVWTLLGAFRVNHPVIRKAAWSVVLLASFTMPVLGGHMLRLQSWKGPETGLFFASPLKIISDGPASWGGDGRHLLPNTQLRVMNSQESGRVCAELILTAYLLVTVVLLLRIAIGLLKAHAVWNRAVNLRCGERGLVRLSVEVVTPWTFRSRILLPHDALNWPKSRLSVVLAHEREHIRQMDFYLQIAARIYTALFWISPLGWWLQREYARLGEQTSDLAGLSHASSGTAYADILMNFCVENGSYGVLHMARASGLRSRIDLILDKGAQERLLCSPTRAIFISACVFACAFALATASVEATQQDRNLAAGNSVTRAWEQAAGGRRTFEVASVRPSAAKFRPPSFPMSADDSFKPIGGLFFADFPVSVYIQFAYKLSMTPKQIDAALSKQPEWAKDQRFTINARTDQNATKDQYRLMMQSLLQERFGLKLHFEDTDTAIYALTLVKPNVTGPKLRPHAEGPPCSPTTNEPYSAEVKNSSDVFPTACAVFMAHPTTDHLTLVGARDTTIELIGAAVSSLGQLDRPVVDATGLSGRFDFTLTWKAAGPDPAQNDAENNFSGPSLGQALRDQLGVKLTSTRAPILQPVIDHLELPSTN
jgi:bla regulator protein blaR1